MSFSIPNDADASYGPQAGLDTVDIAAIVAAFGRTRVVSGGAVTQRAAGANMSVDVGAGVGGVDGTRHTWSGVNAAVTTADSTNGRFDLVVYTVGTGIQVVAGTPAADADATHPGPVFPAVPANSLLLAALYIPAGASSVITAMITDKRVIGVLKTDPVVATLTDAATVTPDVDGYDGGTLATLSQTTTFANPTGSPVAFQKYLLRIKSTTARTLSWGSAYRAGVDIALPGATSGGGLTDYIGFQWNEADSKWDLLALARGY